MKRIFYVWFPPVLWAILIFVLSCLPINIRGYSGIIFVDKILHFLIFMPLGFFLGRAFLLSKGEKIRENYILLTLIYCLIYAFSDEFHQLFTASRQASLADVFFDFLGTGAGLIALGIVNPVRESKRLNKSLTG